VDAARPRRISERALDNLSKLRDLRRGPNCLATFGNEPVSFSVSHWSEATEDRVWSSSTGPRMGTRSGGETLSFCWTGAGPR